MVGNVKWEGEHRALFAVPYPRGLTPFSSPAAAGARVSLARANDTAIRIGQGESSREVGSCGTRSQRKKEGESCLVVAASDKSVKFHEIWGSGRSKFTQASEPGLLGGSDILEMAEGIDKVGDIIR